MMRCNLKRWLGVASVMGLGLVVACSVTVNTGNGDGTTPAFEIAGSTFSFSLGEEGSFDIIADGPAVQKTFTVNLFSETPDDEPTGATLILPAEGVTFVPEGSTGKPAPVDQDSIEPFCEMEVYIADSSVADPCQDGGFVGAYEVYFFQGEITPIDDNNRVLGSLLDIVRSGLFNMCIKVKGKESGRLFVEGFQITYDSLSADDNANDNANTNDNTPDNTNDNVDDNANDNIDDIDDNVNDNTDDEDPVDTLDPDGDGLYEAHACDSRESVVITADDPLYNDGTEYCGAKIHFTNVGSHNIVVLWHAQQLDAETGEVVWDGWYSVALDEGGESSSTDRTWIYNDFGVMTMNTDEVMVYRADEGYQDGCSWLGTAIREDDSGIDLLRVDVASLNPCE
jgi:hypothetical protein